MNRRVSVSEAARTLNVSASTIQRLCNRGLLEYETTQGGHRRIHLQSLATLLEQLRGTTLDVLLQESTGALSTLEIIGLLLAGNEPALLAWAKQSIDQPQALLKKLEQQLLPAIMELDSRYVQQQLEKHRMWLAVNTARIVLERLSARLPLPSRDARWAVGGLASESPSSLGLRLVEVGLQLAGFHALGLGLTKSPQDLVDMAIRCKASLVWISHAHIANADGIIAWHRELATQLPIGIRVVIGGGALSPSVRRQLPSHTYYETIADMVAGESQPQLPLPPTGPHFRLGSPATSLLANPR